MIKNEYTFLQTKVDLRLFIADVESGDKSLLLRNKTLFLIEKNNQQEKIADLSNEELEMVLKNKKKIHLVILNKNLDEIQETVENINLEIVE